MTDGNNDASQAALNAEAGRDTTESTSNAPGGFWQTLFDLPALLLKVHLLIGALLFPYSLRIPKAEYEGPTASYQLWCLLCGSIILLINLFLLFAVVDFFVMAIQPVLKVLSNWQAFMQQPSTLLAAWSQVNFIQFAKAIFVTLAWVLSLTAFIVVNNEKMITALLFAVEDEASQTRDESVMLIRAGQAGIRGLNAKLWGEEKQGISPSELIRSIGPLALLFFNKERSILRWGMVGANAVAKGFKFLQQFSKQK
jgi:hypothetical protein